MAKVDITVQEAKAIRELMNDAKVPIPMGYILGSFMIKVEQSIGKEQEQRLKDKLTKNDKKASKKDKTDSNE